MHFSPSLPSSFPDTFLPPIPSSPRLLVLSSSFLQLFHLFFLILFVFLLLAFQFLAFSTPPSPLMPPPPGHSFSPSLIPLLFLFRFLSHSYLSPSSSSFYLHSFDSDTGRKGGVKDTVNRQRRQQREKGALKKGRDDEKQGFGTDKRSIWETRNGYGRYTSEIWVGRDVGGGMYMGGYMNGEGYNKGMDMGGNGRVRR